MANTTKTTTSSTVTKAKAKEPKVEAADIKTNNDALAEALAEIERLKAQNEELSKANSQSTPIIIQGNSPSSKKVKCINMLHHPVGVSTEPWGQGRVYYFEKYGQSILIKFDNLISIVSSYPNTMEQGHIYIDDPQAVEELGLAEEYKQIYNQNNIDKMSAMDSDECVELFVKAQKDIQESVAVDIAKNMANGKEYDRNILNKVKDATGKDIVKLSEDIRMETKRDTE